MQTVAIIGLGYVGLPLFCLIANTPGYRCFGVDIDNEKLDLIQSRKLTYNDELVKNFYQNHKYPLSLSTKAEEFVLESEIIIICVPTPVDAESNPDFGPLISATKSIVPALKKGHLVIIESTIYPGSTEEIILPILEKSGLKGGMDFFVAHCPERIDPGNKKWNLRNIPRVCGALSPKGLKLTVDFYKSILEADVVPLSSLKAAEACKVIENSFRDINIAFVNELAMSFDKMGIDVLEVINGASTKPFAFIPHYPGTGVGGHCIPVDPYYLIKKAADLGFDHEFLKTARKINNLMPYYCVELLDELITESKSSTSQQTVGLMGIAFKKNIDDIRNSPYFIIKAKLDEKGYNVISFDPYVTSMSTVASLEELIQKSTFLILITDHKEFQSISPQILKENDVIGIVDGRNVLDKEEIKKEKILYRGIGRR